MAVVLCVLQDDIKRAFHGHGRIFKNKKGAE